MGLTSTDSSMSSVALFLNLIPSSVTITNSGLYIELSSARFVSSDADANVFETLKPDTYIPPDKIRVK